MMSDPSAIGIMEGAYFVSKSDLLDWLRTDFNIDIAKIEECGTGVIYLRILDRMFPGRVPMRKVKMNARQEWECLHNLKILQSVFIECKIQKHLDIDRLAKCMYLDNLECLQWMKRFYDRNYMEHDMTAVDISPTRQWQSSTSGSPSVHTSQRAAPAVSGMSLQRRGGGLGTVGTGPSASLSRATKPSSRPGPRVAAQNSQATSETLRKQPASKRSTDTLTEEITRLKAALETRENELLELQYDNEAIDEERQFYFGKLRKLEVMSNEPGRTTFTVKEVQNILFTMDDVGKDLQDGILPAPQNPESSSVESIPPSDKLCDGTETTTSATASGESQMAHRLYP